MKYLGVDYGGKRIGLAFSDAGGTFAFPHSVVPNDEKAAEAVTVLVKNERAEAIVMGDTRGSSGVENPITAEAESFARKIEKASCVPVLFVSELGSSVEVSRYAPEGRGHDDAAAAAFILQRYLDMKGNGR